LHFSLPSSTSTPLLLDNRGMKSIVHFFDKLEDRIRGRLSRFPILYTAIGGIGIVLFWRGVWITADEISILLPPAYLWLNGPISVAVSVIILLMTGLFVSLFITDKIIMSGLKKEKKLVEKAESELKEESGMIAELKEALDHIKLQVKEINEKLK